MSFNDASPARRVSSFALPQLIDMIDDAVIVTGADLRSPGPFIEYVNAAFERMTGYTADEVMGRSPRFLQGPLTDRSELDRMHRDLAAAERFEAEIVNYRKDGQPFAIEWRVKALYDEEGAIAGWLSVQRDITNQRRAAEVQKRLAREVDHRAKNALALVQGIVRLTKAETADGYAEAVQGRVDALATAHGLLSETAWRGVSLKRLIDAELARDVRTGEADAAGCELLLPPGLVQPIALLIHEMVCNATKYGSLGVKTGRVDIRWSTADGNVILDWAERGGPAPLAERPTGFGLSMIQAIARRQLGGEAKLEWQPDGLTAHLQVPLRRAGGQV